MLLVFALFGGLGLGYFWAAATIAKARVVELKAYALHNKGASGGAPPTIRCIGLLREVVVAAIAA